MILLTNSVHPHRGKSLTSLRSRVATIAAASFNVDVPASLITGYNDTITGPGLHRVVGRNAHTLTGLDVLVEQNFAPLAGKAHRPDHAIIPASAATASATSISCSRPGLK